MAVGSGRAPAGQPAALSERLMSRYART